MHYKQQKFTLPKIGGRVWKTGVAVALSLAVCWVFSIPEPVFAGIAAVICMQPTVLQTFKKGFERLQATVIGALLGLGVMALITLYPEPYVKPLAAGIAVIVVMWICLFFRWLDALSLATTTVVVIIAQTHVQGSLSVYAAERTLVTGIGVVVASVVNAVMFWPRIEDRFPKRLPHIAEQSFSAFEQAVAVFVQRDLDLARSYLVKWNQEQESFKLAASELTWFEESLTVRQMFPLLRENRAPVFSEIYFILESINQTARRLLEETISVLEEHPEYVVQDAQVYQIINEALQSSAQLSRAINKAMISGNRALLEESNHQWTKDLHSQFIRSIRAAHKSPRDIFPLFEVAKIGIELRSYTRSLVHLKDMLIEDNAVMDILNKYSKDQRRDLPQETDTEEPYGDGEN